MLNDSPVGCQTRAVTEPQRDGGICEANDGEVFKTATFKPLSRARKMCIRDRVWIGDDASTNAGYTGGTIPAAIWRDYMYEAESGYTCLLYTSRCV